MQVVVDIPDNIAERLAPAGADLSRTMLEDRIAQAYREGRLTTEEIRQALGLETRFEVEPFLLRHDIFDYTPDMLIKDLDTLERLRG
jgi:Uncharacterised protein family (UPF0175)